MSDELDYNSSLFASREVMEYELEALDAKKSDDIMNCRFEEAASLADQQLQLVKKLVAAGYWKECSRRGSACGSYDYCKNCYFGCRPD